MQQPARDDEIVEIAEAGVALSTDDDDDDDGNNNNLVEIDVPLLDVDRHGLHVTQNIGKVLALLGFVVCVLAFAAFSVIGWGRVLALLGLYVAVFAVGLAACWAPGPIVRFVGCGRARKAVLWMLAFVSSVSLLAGTVALLGCKKCAYVVAVMGPLSAPIAWLLFRGPPSRGRRRRTNIGLLRRARADVEDDDAVAAKARLLSDDRDAPPASAFSIDDDHDDGTDNGGGGGGGGGVVVVEPDPTRLREE